MTFLGAVNPNTSYLMFVFARFYFNKLFFNYSNFPCISIIYVEVSVNAFRYMVDNMKMACDVFSALYMVVN